MGKVLPPVYFLLALATMVGLHFLWPVTSYLSRPWSLIGLLPQREHAGDTVRAGQEVARIGNNGSSFHPHVHVGAFLGDLMSDDAVPLQIQMDLEAMGRVRGTARE